MGWHGRGEGLVAFGGDGQVRRCMSCRLQSAAPSRMRFAIGRVAEWFKAPVLKTGVPARVPWVRIPPLPPDLAKYPRFLSIFVFLPTHLPIDTSPFVNGPARAHRA